MLWELEAFNIQQAEKYEAMKRPRDNGIACPKCMHELRDSSPELLLTSFPPQKHVHCEECGFRGYRIA